MSNAVVVVSFKDMATDEELREELASRCDGLAGEFPEITHVEVTLTPDGVGHTAHGHVTGKSTRLATHSSAVEPGRAADQLLDTLRQQLRRAHDKRIFSHRREAQQQNPKRAPRKR
jgi:ribosome-associated translation inhibitor RaiA